MKKDHHFGEQKAGLLCYIVGMVVLLTVYQAVITTVTEFNFFDTVSHYQKLVQGLSVSLLFLMLGLLWMAYRQWRTITYEHDQLETILESIGPDVIVAIDRNNRILRCGGAVEQMSGYTPQELTGQKADLLYHDRNIGGHNYEIQSAIQQAGFHLGYATGRTKDGKDYLLEIQTSGLHSRNGGAVLILHNLDERHHARAQLQRRFKLEETVTDISAKFINTASDRFEDACLDALKQTAAVFDYEFAGVGFFSNGDQTHPEFRVWPQDSATSDPTFTGALAEAAAAIGGGRKEAYCFPQNLKSAPQPLVTLHNTWDLQSVVLSPMKLQGQTFGFLALYSKERARRWAPQDTGSLRAVTNTFLTGWLGMRTAGKCLDTTQQNLQGNQPIVETGDCNQPEETT